MSEGKKYDSGKPRLGLLPPYATVAVARVLSIGALKYSPSNWKYVAGGETRYVDAALRHLFSYMADEKTDPETGENHLSHAICCLMFLLDHDETGTKFPTEVRETFAKEFKPATGPGSFERDSANYKDSK